MVLDCNVHNDIAYQLTAMGFHLAGWDVEIPNSKQ